VGKKNWEGVLGRRDLPWNPPPHTHMPKEEKEEKIAFCMDCNAKKMP